jgi:hypothetical protein
MNVLANLLLGAAVAFSAGTAVGQPAAQEEPTPATKPGKVTHAGGRHDQSGHEATLRARAQGQTTPKTAVHSGGRHEVHGQATKPAKEEPAASKESSK